MTEVNGQRRGAALLFDEIPGFQKGFRVLTGSMLNAKRLALTLGYRDIDSDQQLVSRLQGKMLGFEQAVARYPIQETTAGPVLQNRQVGAAVNLLKFPAPKWHAHDGGNYLGTGWIAITKDPDSGRINFGTYRLMVQDEKTITLHISSAHHGAINIKKYQDRNEPAPVVVSLGHHPLYLIVSAMGIPYGISAI